MSSRGSKLLRSALLKVAQGIDCTAKGREEDNVICLPASLPFCAMHLHSLNDKDSHRSVCIPTGHALNGSMRIFAGGGGKSHGLSLRLVESALKILKVRSFSTREAFHRIKEDNERQGFSLKARLPRYTALYCGEAFLKYSL